MKTTPQTFLKFIAGAAVAAAVLFLVWYFSSIVVYILTVSYTHLKLPTT